MSIVRRSLRGIFGATLSVATVLLISNPASGAEGQPSSPIVATAQLPQDIPPLPGPLESDHPLYLTKSNASLFHEILLAPLASWLKDGIFIGRVARTLGYNWELSAEWTRASAENAKHFTLDEQANLVLREGTPLPGFPFGLAEAINAEQDPVRRAYKILWNLTYAEAPSVDVLYELELSWIGARGQSRSCSGVFYRQMAVRTSEDRDAAARAECKEGEQCGPAPKEAVFREEVLHFRAPPVVLGFAQIARRYLGPREDDLWMHSPVTGQNRHIFSSNRSDPILGGLLTFDDLFVWSGKVQAFNAKVVDEKVLLAPFVSTRALELTKVQVGRPSAVLPASVSGSVEPVKPGWGGAFHASGVYSRRDGTPSNMIWNFESAKFPQAAPWVPSAAIFVPRRVWIVEVSPRDPYYLSGRQILVIDQESMLPLYKVVYDRNGAYKKTVIGAWGLAASPDGSVRFPFFGFVLAVKHDAQFAMAATSSGLETFLGRKIGRSDDLRKLLHIESYGKKEAAPPSGEGTVEPPVADTAPPTMEVGEAAPED